MTKMRDIRLHLSDTALLWITYTKGEALISIKKRGF